ncbi:MAG TPA: choice-of-anchor tandem repeat GloVer-containing protein, partial [Candidatus Tumulicola sp.]|nr:choice-of-anchor tandem repeat GloVer-containing protein [Candidatus Tumulicola sp.]
DSTGEHVVYSFKGGSDGAYPAANLNYVAGKLYGVTSSGGFDGCSGSRGCGTVFAVTPSGKETLLHAFGGGLDGANPQARLTDVKGVLYGTTVDGGGYADDGTVFKITTKGRESVLHAFQGGSDGAHPKGRLTNVGGVLYGTASDGGKYERGTVFKITTSGAKQNLYSFGAYPYDAAQPAAGVTYLDGNFYGTTAAGGAFCYYLSECGTIYSMTPSGAERVLYSFQEGSDGAIPVAALTAIGGNLYGTAYDGPVQGYQPYFGCGSVFEITTSGQMTVLSSLGGAYGCHPAAPVTVYGSDIVGTSSRGGRYRRGAAFEIAP